MARPVPAIHDFIEISLVFKSWMPDIKSGMTCVATKKLPPQNNTSGAFSSEVGATLREENAKKQEDRAYSAIQSLPDMLYAIF